ncbi:MAG: rod shape-determining protein MreC [Candidatus Omnitrophica bacterium]|nr:rod shape-determining protein MreC [Candidatus Omnitrophota bacterium]
MIKPEKNLPIIAVLVFIAAITLLSQIFSSDFRVKTLDALRIPLKLISGSVYALRDVSDFMEIRAENKILRENTANLEMEVLNLREAKLENERLKKLLDFKESDRRKFLPALVIARNPSGLNDTVVIDRGRKDKIEKGMVVISGSGLAGRVMETGWRISRVLLVTDYDSTFSGVIETTRDEGAVSGSMRAGLVMKYLDIGCNAKKGDKVITSGLYGVFEKGLLIGEVVSLEQDSSGLYMNAIVKPEVDVRKLEEVLVVR